MFSLLRQRNYALLWAAAFISCIGDFVFIAALPYFVYATSGSALASAATFVSETIPAILLSSIGGVYADRWRRKPVLVVSDWLRGLILLPLIAVHSTSTLWIVYLTAFFGSAVANFAGPFSSAAVPHVVQERDLPAANAAFSAGNYLAVLVGSPLGGLLLQRTGLSGIVIADALTFLASGALIAVIGVSLERRLEESRDTPDAGTALSRIWNEWLAGLQLILRERWLSIFFVVTTVMALANGMSLVILVPFVRHTLGGSPQLYSWTLMAQGLGAIAGSLAIGRAGARFSPALLLSLGVLLFGVLTVAMALAASAPVTLVGTLLGGFNVMFIVVSMTTLLQSRVSDAYRGRVFGSHRTTGALVGLIAPLLAGFLGDAIGPRITFGLAGMLFVVAGTLGLTVLVPALRSAEPAV